MPHVMESQPVFQGPENGLSLINPERNPNQTLTAHPFQDTRQNKSRTDDSTISEKETEHWQR